MTSAPSSSRLERFAPHVAGVLLSIPTLAAYYPPMSDLPLHESVVGILRHWGDPVMVPPIYRLNIGHPNQLFHGLGYLFSLAFGVRWSVKLVIALTQIAILVAGARAADHLGRSRWSALLLAPLALGFTYYWGLVANLLGFVALLAAIPVLDRGAAGGRLKDAFASIGVLVFAFFAHESVFVILAGLAAGLALLQDLSPRKTAVRLLPTIVAMLMFVLQLAWQASLFAKAVLRPPVSFFPLSVKLSMFSNVLFGSHEGPIRDALTGLALLVMVLMGVTRWQHRVKGAATPWRARVHHFRWELGGALLLLAYFTMPFNWNGTTLLHERFLGPAWALLVVTAAPRRSVPTPRVAIFGAVTVPLAVLLVSWPQFVEQDRNQRDLDAIIDFIPKGGAATFCSLDRSSNSMRVYSVAVGGARTPARRGGRGGFTLFVSPISPVQVKPELRWDEFEERMYSAKTLSLRPKHDLRLFPYVVGQARDLVMRAAMVEAMKPEATLLAARGEWLIFRSNLETIPVTSPEPPVPPGVSDDTVVARAVALIPTIVAQINAAGEDAPLLLPLKAVPSVAPASP
jgi:hypothetical protein